MNIKIANCENLHSFPKSVKRARSTQLPRYELCSYPRSTAGKRAIATPGHTTATTYHTTARKKICHSTHQPRWLDVRNWNKPGQHDPSTTDTRRTNQQPILSTSASAKLCSLQSQCSASTDRKRRMKHENIFEWTAQKYLPQSHENSYFKIYWSKY